MNSFQMSVSVTDVADCADHMITGTNNYSRPVIIAAALSIAACLINPGMSPEQLVEAVIDTNQYLAVRLMPADEKGN